MSGPHKSRPGMAKSRNGTGPKSPSINGGKKIPYINESFFRLYVFSALFHSAHGYQLPVTRAGQNALRRTRCTSTSSASAVRKKYAALKKLGPLYHSFRWKFVAFFGIFIFGETWKNHVHLSAFRVRCIQLRAGAFRRVKTLWRRYFDSVFSALQLHVCVQSPFPNLIWLIFHKFKIFLIDSINYLYTINSYTWYFMSFGFQANFSKSVSV